MSAVKVGRAAIVGFMLAAGALIPDAHGAEDPADALVRRGAEMRENDRHQEALELFRQAHAISPSGRTLAQMGLAEFSLKSYVEAEAHLVGALADNSPWVVKNRGVLEQALADVRKHVAVVAISGLAGAEVWVNGKPVGRLPLAAPVRVAEGTIRIEGNAPDHRPGVLDLPVEGGREISATLQMAPLAPPVPVAAPPPAALGLVSAGGAPSETSRRWQQWVGGGLLAVSAAALTTGIIWIAVDGNAACDIPSAAPAGSRCLDVYDTRTRGWVAVGVGLAAGVAGGVLLWKGRGADVQVSVAPGSLTAFGRF